MRGNLFFIVLAFYTLFFSQYAFPDPKKPTWTVNNIPNRTSMTLSFSGFVPTNGILTSASNDVLITRNKNKSVLTNTPSGCRVGSSAVANAQVYFVINGTEYIDNVYVDDNGFVGSGSGYNGAATVAIRFKGISTSAYGNITCSSAGSLTYSW